MNKILRIITFLLFSMFFTACSVDALATPTPAGEAAGNGYPYPSAGEAYPSYPLSVPGKEAFEANVTPNAPAPEFSTDTGAFTIKLIYPDGEKPVRGLQFFAAETIPVTEIPGGFIPALDTLRAPSGQSDSQGVLVISNILPGKYVLALLTPLGPILVEDLATEESIVFDVLANQLTDLGEIIVLLNADKLEP